MDTRCARALHLASLISDSRFVHFILCQQAYQSIESHLRWWPARLAACQLNIDIATARNDFVNVPDRRRYIRGHKTAQPKSYVCSSVMERTLLAQDNEGRTALHLAAENKHYSTVQALLDLTCRRQMLQVCYTSLLSNLSDVGEEG